MKKPFDIRQIKVDNEGGPSGPTPSTISPEVNFKNGNPSIPPFELPKKKQRILPNKNNGKIPHSYENGSIPSDPMLPEKPVKVVEPASEESMSYSERIVAMSSQVFFKDVLRLVKNQFPEMTMQFPEPPTYVWNPKEDSANIDTMQIKNKLKVKFPKLVWSPRNVDGVDTAIYEFQDESYAEFLIGADANHLTLIYNRE